MNSKPTTRKNDLPAKEAQISEMESSDVATGKDKTEAQLGLPPYRAKPLDPEAHRSQTDDRPEGTPRP